MRGLGRAAGRQYRLLRHPAAPLGLGGMQNPFENKRKRIGFGKTYYQAVIRRWQNKITDADTRRETVSAVSPKIVLNDAPKWAVMLETEWQDGEWFEGRLAQEWLDKGVAANREQVAALETELKQKPAQLLIGVRAQTVPDRGVLRQIVRLSEAAQGGAVVQLWRNRGFQTTFRKSWNIGVTRWPNAARRGLSLTGRRRKGV